jgi:hypothetical protein
VILGRREGSNVEIRRKETGRCRLRGSLLTIGHSQLFLCPQRTSGFSEMFGMGEQLVPLPRP